MTNKEFINGFIDGSVTFGSCNSLSCRSYADGRIRVINTYDKPLAIMYEVELYLNTDSYSVTSSRHRNMVRGGFPWSGSIFEVSERDMADIVSHAAAREQCTDFLLSIKRRKYYK